MFRFLFVSLITFFGLHAISSVTTLQYFRRHVLRERSGSHRPKILLPIVCLVSIPFLSGCAGMASGVLAAASVAPLGGMTSTTSETPKPELTQLQKRQLQQRSYDAVKTSDILTVAISVLQDDGFVVQNANPDLGLLNMTKQFSKDTTQTYQAGLFYQVQIPSSDYSTITANLTVREHGEQTRVRLSANLSKMGMGGMVADELLDPTFYQNFYAKLEKGIFIENQKL